MSAQLGHEAVQELLGAYALDAVDHDEAAAVKAHLETCPRCRAELDAHLEVAAALGNTNDDVPAGLWDRIAAGVAQGWERDEPATLPSGLREELMLAPPPTTDRRPARWRWPALVAAVLALLVAGLGVELANLQGQINNQHPADQAQVAASGVVAALANPDHQVASLRTPSGHQVAQAVVADGHGFFVTDDLRPLGSDQTYQLWGLISNEPISLGLLGPHPGTAGFNVGTSSPTAIMITVEPRNGVAVPDQTPLAKGTPT